MRCSPRARPARFPTDRRTAPPSWPEPAFSPEIAKFVGVFAWQGKVFDSKAGLLRNRIGPFGLNAIIAKVYKAPSWLDGKECIVLDYSDTSMVAHWVRDEIRLIQPPGLYLGKVYGTRLGSSTSRCSSDAAPAA